METADLKTSFVQLEIEIVNLPEKVEGGATNGKKFRRTFGKQEHLPKKII